jgi:hypothetical protein
MEFSLKRNIVHIKRSRLPITGSACSSVIANYTHAGILVPSEWCLRAYESLKWFHITNQWPTRDRKARGDFLWTEYHFAVQEFHAFSFCSWNIDFQVLCENCFVSLGTFCEIRVWQNSVPEKALTWKLKPNNTGDVRITWHWGAFVQTLLQ